MQNEAARSMPSSIAEVSAIDSDVGTRVDKKEETVQPMKKNFFTAMVCCLVSLIAACSNQSQKAPQENEDVPATTETHTAPPAKKDTTSISLSSDGASVQTSGADVKVGDQGASVKTKKVQVQVKNDENKKK